MSLLKNFAAALLLAGSTCAGATPPVPSFILGTAPLAPHETHISRVYLALFGRAPELGGLNYWSAQIPYGATLESVYDTIAPFAASISVSPANEDNFTFVKYLYAFVLGKSYEDDPSGVQYWACQLSNDGSQMTEPTGGTAFCLGGYANRSRGELLNSLLAAAAGTPDPYSHDVFANRMLALEYAGRIQKARAKAVTVPESGSLLRRITNTDASFNESMADLDRLTQSGTGSSPSRRFDLSYTTAGLYSEARPAPLNNNVKVHKHLVWYNGSRDMLLAHAYFPPGYLAGSNYTAVVSVHGGGWRNGTPDLIEAFNTGLAAQGFVVLAPTYRLTSWGSPYASPSAQDDLADFVNVIKGKASTLKIKGDKIRLFGHSAGGHLVTLLGTLSNFGCVASVAAPLNLTGNDIPIPGTLDTVMNYYVVSPATRASVSPASQPANASSTKFLVHFGNIDDLVPPSQGAAFQAALGTARVQTIAYNESHMFTNAGTAAVTVNTANFFKGPSCP
jgi:acetyl esterase/lipase